MFVKRMQVSIRERNVEPFHAWTVLEPSSGNPFFDGSRYGAIQHGEEAEAVASSERMIDDVVESR